MCLKSLTYVSLTIFRFLEERERVPYARKLFWSTGTHFKLAAKLEEFLKLKFTVLQ